MDNSAALSHDFRQAASSNQAQWPRGSPNREQPGTKAMELVVAMRTARKLTANYLPQRLSPSRRVFSPGFTRDQVEIEFLDVFVINEEIVLSRCRIGGHRPGGLNLLTKQ